jgi:RNA polymerase sigma-70 factor (ECF subfamily)
VAEDKPDPGGEAAALERLYGAYRSRIYGFLYRMAGTRDGADDLFQETWLRVARNWADRAGIADEEAWLFTVARNVFLSERRATATKLRGAEELKLVPAPAGRSPEHVAEDRQDAAALEAALAALSADDRAILWLVAVEGLEQRQIAEVLGIGYPAVRQRLARARERLSERLAHATLDGREPDPHKANQS